MLQNIWYILRRKTMPVLILISGSQRCLPICGRSAIQHALGTVSSYKTRLDLWEKTDGKSREAQSLYMKTTPCRSSTVMSCISEGAEGKDEAYLKLYDGHDWKWFCVRLDHTDMEYLRKNAGQGKRHLPRLWRKRHRKYFLRFSYTEEVTLTKTPVKEQIICSVDLGNQYRCGLYHYAGRRNCPGKKIYRSSQ